METTIFSILIAGLLTVFTVDTAQKRRQFIRKN